MTTPTLRVDRARLERTFEEQAKIGATARGGLTRLALSDEDRVIRDRMVAWLEQAGCTVRVDRMGNIFGRRPAAPGGDARPAVVMGSHDDIERGADVLLHAALALAGNG